MHDIFFSKGILKSIEPYIEKDKKVHELVLEVGELVGIEPDHLVGTLNDVSNYKFKAQRKYSKIECPCGYTGLAKIIERLHDKVIWACPACELAPEMIKVVEGDQIKLLKVIYD